MWHHYQRVVGEGRIPTGAELDRVAGTSSYGVPCWLVGVAMVGYRRPHECELSPMVTWRSPWLVTLRSQWEALPQGLLTLRYGHDACTNGGGDHGRFGEVRLCRHPRQSIIGG